MPLLMCPNCNNSMQELTRADVQFDMCPSCRGVWLDRGELEKMIEGARAGASPSVPDQTSQLRPYDKDDSRRDQHQGQYRKKKRDGFDIFDIFD